VSTRTNGSGSATNRFLTTQEQAYRNWEEREDYLLKQLHHAGGHENLWMDHFTTRFEEGRAPEPPATEKTLPWKTPASCGPSRARYPPARNACEDLVEAVNLKL